MVLVREKLKKSVIDDVVALYLQHFPRHIGRKKENCSELCLQLSGMWGVENISVVLIVLHYTFVIVGVRSCVHSVASLCCSCRWLQRTYHKWWKLVVSCCKPWFHCNVFVGTYIQLVLRILIRGGNPPTGSHDEGGGACAGLLTAPPTLIHFLPPYQEHPYTLIAKCSFRELRSAIFFYPELTEGYLAHHGKKTKHFWCQAGIYSL